MPLLTSPDTTGPALVEQPAVLSFLHRRRRPAPQVELIPIPEEDVCFINRNWEQLLVTLRGFTVVPVPVWTNTPTRPNQLTSWGQGSITACSGFSMAEILDKAGQRLIPLEMQDGCGPGAFDFLFVPNICGVEMPPPPPEPPVEPPEPPVEPPEPPVVPACVSPADCPTGMVCIGGECVPAPAPPEPVPVGCPDWFPILLATGGWLTLALLGAQKEGIKSGARPGPAATFRLRPGV